MALAPPEFFEQSWVREQFMRELRDYRAPSFIDWFSQPKRPTAESIKADVAKLKSVSEVGRAWIADRRMAIASVGPWQGVFVFPRDGKYPLFIVKHRQERVTYSTRLARINPEK